MNEILTEVKGRLAVVTLNRPQSRNAMTLAMWRRVPEILADLEADARVRAIVLTGANGHFSGGADIKEFGTVRSTVEQSAEYEREIERCCDAIAASPRPTIAVIRGYCMGGACHLAMSCDFRFAEPTAQFAIPAARLSIVYGVDGTKRLVNLVGAANAKRILFSAERFDATEGFRIGFVDRVEVDPDAAAAEFAAVIAENAPLTIAGTKVVVNGLTGGMGALREEVVDEVMARAAGSDDYREGRSAFVERRRPVFKGR